MMNFHDIDFSIIITCISICFIVAFYKSPKIRNLKHYATGYKDVSVSVLICTIFASSVGAGSTIGYSKDIYQLGSIVIIGHFFFQPVTWFITAKIIIPGIEKFKGCLSISEVMYKLYGSYARWLTSIAAVIMGIGVVAAQISILGKIFNYFFKMEVKEGIILGYGILAIYSILGGIKSLSFAEVFKFIISFLIFPIVYIVTFVKVGGFDTLFQKLPATHLGLELTLKNINLLLNYIIYSLIPGFTAPFIQKCLMANSAKQLKDCFKNIVFIYMSFTLSLCAISYITRAIAIDIKPDQVFLYFISHLLPSGLRGLTIIGVMIIIIVMAGAWVNAINVILFNDIINVLKSKKDKLNQIKLIKVILISFSMILITFTFEAKEFTGFIHLILNFWLPIILIPLSAGFLGFRTNSLSFVASSILALLFTCIGRFVTGEFAVFSLCFGIIGSVIGLFGMHYLQVLKGKINIEIKETSEFNFSDKIKYKIVTIKQVFTKLFKVILQVFKKKNVHIKYHGFCAFTLTYYFIYTLSLTSDPAHKIFAYIISVGYLLCMLLLLKDFVFSKTFQQKYLHLYWYFTVTFCLPLASSFMLFAGHGNNFWVINGVLAAISLYLFVDAISFLVLLSIGVAFGYLIFTITGQKVGNINNYNSFTIGYIYLFLMFISLFFFRKKEKEQEERVQNMHIFGGAMAHEVKSPLATLNMCAATITGQLERTYSESSDKQHFSIEKEDMDVLLQFSRMLEKVSVQGISTVDGLLTSLKSDVIADDKEVYTIKDCIMQAVSEYQALNNNLNRINIKIISNFKFYGSLHYLKHVLFNLLTNSYKYGGKNIEVDIRTKGNQLYFKDSGKGIAEEDLPYIFDRFYSKNKTGTGIGLAFCKMVMEDVGGSIDCKSKLGEYTEFTLSFPKIAKL